MGPWVAFPPTLEIVGTKCIWSELVPSYFYNRLSFFRRTLWEAYSVPQTAVHYCTRLTTFFPGTTWVSRYQKGKTRLDLSEAREDGVWGRQWHQPDHMRTVCTSLQTDNHTNVSPIRLIPWGPIYKISYAFSQDYRKFIVRSTYDSDLKSAKISFRNIVS